MGKQEKLKAQKRAERQAENLKAWRIDVRPYPISIVSIDEDGKMETEDGRPIMVEDEFDVKGSLAAILFNPTLQLKPQEGFEAHDLAKKIRAADGHVILDSRERGMVTRAYEALRGVTENQIEFLRRISEAEEVTMEEAKD